jgi:hypothetical protein
MSWLDDYQNTATQYVDAPRLFQKAIAYWTLGAALQRTVYYQFGMQPIYPNLFLVLVGKSGAIKKSVTKNFALDVLEHCWPSLDLPGRGSPEAFRDALEEKNWYGVLHFDEFWEFLLKRKKDYSADMDTTIMELFVHGRKSPIRTKTSGEIRIPSEAMISFISPTTLDLLVAGTSRSDMMSGKMARFMMIAAEQDIEYPVPQALPHTIHPYLGAGLKKLVPNVQHSTPMQETPAARVMLEEVYYGVKDRIKGSGSPLFGSSFSRAQVYAVKLAMINAIANGRMVIDAVDYEETLPLLSVYADTLTGLADKVMSGDGPFQKLVQDAEAFISAHGKVYQSELVKKLAVRKYEQKDVVEYLTASGKVSLVVNASSEKNNVLIWQGNGHMRHVKDDDVAVLSVPKKGETS